MVCNSVIIAHILQITIFFTCWTSSIWIMLRKMDLKKMDPGGIRTRDLRVTKQPLCHLSHQHRCILSAALNAECYLRGKGVITLDSDTLRTTQEQIDNRLYIMTSQSFEAINLHFLAELKQAHAYSSEFLFYIFSKL